MGNFDLRKFLVENRQGIDTKLSEGDYESPAEDIQNKMKELAGYWPVDIKNNLDRLGAEKFKLELDNLKSLVDQYFENK